MTEVISVRFRGGCKNYYFDPKGHAVKMGDQVIVETAQGPEFGTCTQGNHEVADEAVVQPLCAMLRLATDADRRTVDYNRKKESEAFDITLDANKEEVFLWIRLFVRGLYEPLLLIKLSALQI